MSTTTEAAGALGRLGRTRVRVSPGVDGARCRVRTSVTGTDPTVPTVRPVLTHHDARSTRLSLVPEGALLLAGDRIELDVTVDPGSSLEIVEPGGTVAYDMRGQDASWHVDVRVAAGAALTWAGEPFVVAAGADVDRRTRVRFTEGARLAVRETLVLGRAHEPPGRVSLRTDVRSDVRRVLAEDLALDASTAPSLLGRARVMESVLLVLPEPLTGGPDEDRFDLAAPGAILWRRLAGAAHEASTATAWQHARSAVLEAPLPGEER